MSPVCFLRHERFFPFYAAMYHTVKAALIGTGHKHIKACVNAFVINVEKCVLKHAPFVMDKEIHYLIPAKDIPTFTGILYERKIGNDCS